MWLMLRMIAVALLLGTSFAAAQGVTQSGSGVSVRTLDKLTGKVRDFDIADRQSETVGRIMITANECRYPQGNPAGDAYASLTINEIGKDSPVFQGWMIASSPALNAMDHQRYDVWVLRCTTS